MQALAWDSILSLYGEQFSMMSHLRAVSLKSKAAANHGLNCLQEDFKTGIKIGSQ